MSDRQPPEPGSPRSRRDIREAREHEPGAQPESQSDAPKRGLGERLRSVRSRPAASAASAAEHDETADAGTTPSGTSVPPVAPVEGSVIFNQEETTQGKLEREDQRPAEPESDPALVADADADADTATEPTAASAVTPFDQVATSSYQALSREDLDEAHDLDEDDEFGEDHELENDDEFGDEPGDYDDEYAMDDESAFPLEEDLEDDYYEGTRIEHDDDGTPLLITSSSHGRSYQTVSAVEGGATQAVLERRRTRRRRRNLTLSVAFGLFAVLLVGFVVVLQSLFGSGGPEDFETQAGEVVEFTVEEGDGPALVRNRLLEAGIIASDTAFDDAFASLEGAPQLQPGEFQLREQMPAADALAVIFDQGEALHYISLQDNTRIDAALTSIAAQTGIPESDIQRAAQDPGAYGLPDEAETLEGYLAAGEYQPSLDATPEEILQEMVDTTFERLEELGITDEDEQWRTVIVASLLTAEGLPGDYEEIAGIIENRLDPNNSETDGLLQIDATVIYGLGTQSVHFTEEERADASNEYNTYQNPGLPPGPVAAPNMATLEAAANPDENDYYYWVTVDLETGETKFASDYEEHLGYVEEFNAYCEDNPEICAGEPTQENAGP